MKKENKRDQFLKLKTQLESERSSFQGHWRELGDYILPRRPRWFIEDVNRGDRRNTKIIDSTSTLAARTLRSGMMSGITSPARPWFRLTTPNPKLAEYGAVKEWLSDVTSRMESVFLRSNLYNSLPIIYGDMGVFGTAAMVVEEDFDNVIRTYALPIGSYYISNDEKGRVRVFYRSFRMTVRQVVDKFGERDANGKIDFSNFSVFVKNQYDQGFMEAWVNVGHVIQPNKEFNPNLKNGKNKRYSSCYFEEGKHSSGTLEESYSGLLRESGYDEFPVLAPRWEVTGEDAYGTECPGMLALGDIKALQLMHKRKSQAIEKMVYPPMVAPTSMRNVKSTILPGDINYVDEREGQKGFRPAHEVNIRLNELILDIQEHQERIRRSFFEDLFLMLATSDRREITAREVEERHEEKLLAIGPVLEQINQDLLDPLIDIVFGIMLRQGLIPDAPEELQGIDLKVQYISVMAQAQKLVGISGMERFGTTIGALAQSTQNPAVLDKVDFDQYVDVYGDLLSIAPGIVRTDDQVDQIRSSRQQAAQSQIDSQNAKDITTAAKTLSETDINKDSALRSVIDRAQAGAPIPVGGE